MQRTIRKLSRGEGGFTLIELLVVIIIIAVLASIAIPTFFGQREKAQDTQAYSLVRNALTAMQTAFVDTGGYDGITADMLESIETSFDWVDNGGDLVSTSPPGITPSVAADAEEHEVAFSVNSDSVIDLASRSGSGNWFGIQVDTVDLTETGYIKVKLIDGSAEIGW
jgi:type IV pilus assembly protein PilA